MSPNFSSPPPTSSTLGASSGGRDAWWLLPLVFVIVFGDAAWRWPVPAANEPHYLTMARHQWDPDWCRRDLFLQSTPAHTVFYRTVGALAVVFPFEKAAWVGRVLAFGLFAWGWVRLGRVLLPGGVAIVWAVLLYLTLASQGSFSGEWIVRGVEAKVFSYGFFFLALASALTRRWKSSALWWGLSISFHPLVGIWSLLCYVAAEGSVILQKRSQVPMSWREAGKAVAILAIAAAPGLLTTLAVIWGMDPKLQYQATYIQVFYRLAHHLDPMEFPATAYSFAGVLIAVWLCGRHWEPPSRECTCFRRFIAFSIALAVLGVAIGYGPRPGGAMPGFAWRMSLLKFYPFRLFDGVMPIAAAFAVVHIWSAAGYRWVESAPQRRTTFIAIGSLAVIGMWIATLIQAQQAPHVSKMSQARRAAWSEACEWIERETLPDALFITPNESWAFKWHAQRAEFVNMKDCPQDPPHLVEWNRRLKLLAKWGERHFEGGYSRDELHNLQEQTDADYLLAQRLGPMTIEPVFQNDHYRLYALSRGDNR